MRYASISLVAALVSFVICSSSARFAAANDEKLLEKTDQQLQSLYKRVSPAIVRFAMEENGVRSDSVTGVIVSADGLIVTRPNWMFWEEQTKKQPIYCFLADGRVVKC